MAKHTISESARLANMARSALYEHYIKPGKISVCRDERNRPYIETAELVRVFSHLATAESGHPQDGHNRTVDDTSEQTLLAVAQEQLRGMAELMREKDLRIQLLTEQTAMLKNLLEHRQAIDTAVPSKSWWARLRGK